MTKVRGARTIRWMQKGEPGDTGPLPLILGEFDGSGNTDYFWTNEYRCICWVTDANQHRNYYAVRNRGASFTGAQSGTPTSNSAYWMDSWEVGFMKAGAIVSDMIAAGAITAEKIQAGAITAEKLDANAVMSKFFSALAASGCAMQLTGDNLSFYDGSNNRVINLSATIIGNAASLSSQSLSGSLSRNSMVLGIGYADAASHTYANQLQASQNLGYLSTGSTIAIGSFSGSVYVPYMAAGGSIIIYGTKLHLLVKGNGTKYKELTLENNAPYNSGSTISLSGSPTSIAAFTIPYSGTWTIEITLDYSVSFGTNRGNVSSGSITFASTYSTVASMPAKQTKIGRDGMYVYWGANQYLFVSDSEGISLRDGNAGVKVKDGVLKIILAGTEYTATAYTVNGVQCLKLT